jgi:hypothetical protein
MADKFLNTGQGAVNLSNGTVNIIAAELGAVNLVPSKPVKTNATQQLVSADLDIDDITNLQSELSTKTELNFVESDIARVTPSTGELKIYAKSDNHLYKLDDTGDEKQLGNVFSTGTSLNHSLAIFQGGSGEHITDTAITYNPNTNGLVDVTILSNYSNEILLLPSGMQMISPNLTINAVTDLYNNALNNVASLNGIVPANILQNNGTTPMAVAYTPTTAQDVATKTYVDTHSTSNNYLKIDGSSVMSGNLRLGNNNILGAYDIQTGTINGENITTMAADIDTNADSIFTNSLNITSVGGQATSNATAITTLQSGKLSKTGDTMSGDLNMSSNDIIGANSIQTNTIDEVGSQIEVKTGFLKITGGQGDCELRICADANNNNEDYNPRIVFQQDGTDTPGAMWMGNNQLNISSATGAGGINLRTTTTADDWENAPVRMNISPGGDVVIESNLRINSSKATNVGAFKFYAYGSYGGIASGTVNTALYCPSGRVIAQEFGATSDRRCKTDIANIPDEKINAFMRLESKQYYWKDEKESLKYGFIAQDVIHQDLMSCVNFAQMDGMAGGVDEETGVNNPPDICLNLNYDSMVPLLHGALKKAMDRIDTLEQQVSTLL